MGRPVAVPELKITPASPGRGLLVRREGKATLLERGRDLSIMFYDNTVIAVMSGGYVYVHESVVRSVQAAVNRIYLHIPQIRAATDSIDFILGQVLSQTGLSLAKKAE